MATTPHSHILAALVAAAGLALTACNAPTNPGNAQGPAQEASAPKPAVVFDVPALIGKKINEVEQALGPADAAPQPTDEEQRLVGFEWKKTFTKGDYRLVTKYYGESKEVYAFTVTKKNVASGFQPHELETIANVDAAASQYYIAMEPAPGSKVQAGASDAPPELPAFIGITIMPQLDSTATTKN